MRESTGEDRVVCGQCKSEGTFSEPVSVIVVFAPAFQKPYPLIPGEDYSVCTACDAIYRLVDSAVASHPVTRSAGSWTRAIVVFSDGRGADVRAKRRIPQLALA
jgi:hypothetical protein